MNRQVRQEEGIDMKKYSALLIKDMQVKTIALLPRSQVNTKNIDNKKLNADKT